MTYINAQMLQVCPFHSVHGKNGQIKIQIRSECGKTNWLNITPEQFEQIEKVLLEGESNALGN